MESDAAALLSRWKGLEVLGFETANTETRVLEIPDGRILTLQSRIIEGAQGAGQSPGVRVSISLRGC